MATENLQHVDGVGNTSTNAGKRRSRLGSESRASIAKAHLSKEDAALSQWASSIEDEYDQVDPYLDQKGNNKISDCNHSDSSEAPKRDQSGECEEISDCNHSDSIRGAFSEDESSVLSQTESVRIDSVSTCDDSFMPNMGSNVILCSAPGEIRPEPKALFEKKSRSAPGHVGRGDGDDDAGYGLESNSRSTLKSGYFREMSLLLENEVMPKERRKAQYKRLKSFMRCGSHVCVRSCQGCGSNRAGSGTFEGTHTCKTRACPSCAWVRSKRVGEWIRDAYDELSHPGFKWHMFVITIPYDPKDKDSLTVEKLRERARLAGKAVNFLWGTELKCIGAGAYRTIELGSRGHVHANILYYGPPTSDVVINSVIDMSPRYMDSVGNIHVEDVSWASEGAGMKKTSEDARGSKEGLEQAARYISKGISQGAGRCDEDYLSDQLYVATTDVQLAAKWELATHRMQLTQKLGGLRGLDIDEDDGIPHETLDDIEVACTGCGTVGEWSTRMVKADEYILACHDIGEKALVNSNWKDDTEEDDDDWDDGPPDW